MVVNSRLVNIGILTSKPTATLGSADGGSVQPWSKRMVGDTLLSSNGYSSIKRNNLKSYLQGDSANAYAASRSHKDLYATHVSNF
jgi:hypothetical protein